MKYGYTKASTLSQDLESKIQTLDNNGCQKIHSEKFTGTKNDFLISTRKNLKDVNEY